MSKTFGKVFGSSGGKTESQSSVTPTGYESLSPTAKKVYDQAIQTAGQLSADVFAPAPINQQQKQAAEYFGTTINPVNEQEFRTGLATFTNPFEEQVLANIIRDLNTEARGGFSDIASIASDAGGFGSNRRGILEAELQKNLLKQIADTSAASRAANFENAATRTLADIGQVRALNQQNAGALFDIGNRFQDTESAAKRAPAALQEYLANLAGMLKGGGTVLNTNAVTTNDDPGILGRLTSGFGNAAQLAGGFAAFSDSRLKENISLVSKGPINVYEFNYKLMPNVRFRGVMAQEVERIRPEAIGEMHGYKTVNYSMLGMQMEVV